jgi:N-acetylglucosaminyl-diphospho-decaprenol L-rhamnosyltransferase
VDLSICILTSRQPDLLPVCVNSCFAEIGRARLDAEVIVVDNASRDRYPAKLVDRYPRVNVLRSERNLGFSIGNNLAIRRSSGQNILILNDDAVLQQHSLSIMIQKLESNPQIAAVGPRLSNPDGSLQRGFTNKRAVTLRSILSGVLQTWQTFDKFWLTRRMLTQMKDDYSSGEADELAGACLLVRRRALDEIGLFDESFYFWSEDADLCWRLRKAGWKLFYSADVEVTHHGSASLNRVEIFERSKMFYASLLYFMKKHWHPVRYHVGRIAIAAAFLFRVPAGLIYGTLHPGKGVHGGWNSALLSWQMARWLITERR